ncbi:MAG TPA: hypothetical protein VHK67_04775 [Rhabdochlamydiaceae bacterium]|nr:hypothetical protein [Rhabdochlamydiaceae bacterium]
MSVSLSSKLASIQPDQTVSEIDQLLQRPTHVRISWWAQRMVSIDGYTGEVEINTLANKYLEASQFNRDGDFSLQHRVTCYNLWGKVQNLYQQSFVQLGKAWIYWFLTELREFRPYCRACAGDPLAIIGEWEFGSRKESLFQFSPEKFRQLWPTERPIGQSWSFPTSAPGAEKWQASKEMVDQIIQKTASEDALVR